VHNLLHEIEEQTEGVLKLDPGNAVALCSTPGVIEQFRSLGFASCGGALRAEDRGLRRRSRSSGASRSLARRGPPTGDPPDAVRGNIQPVDRLPRSPVRVARLYRDPLLTEEAT